MEIVSRSASLYRMPGRIRLWLAVGAAMELLLVLLPWRFSFGPLEGDVAGTLAATVVIGLPALLLMRAMRRDDFDPRLRQALALLAFSMALSVAGNMLRLVAALGVPMPSVSGVSLASNVVVWALGLGGLVRIPLVLLAAGHVGKSSPTQPSRSEGWRSQSLPSGRSLASRTHRVRPACSCWRSI